jgi:hypothetical protein
LKFIEELIAIQNHDSAVYGVEVIATEESLLTTPSINNSFLSDDISEYSFFSSKCSSVCYCVEVSESDRSSITSYTTFFNSENECDEGLKIKKISF